jgi:SnoaL-like domain
MVTKDTVEAYMAAWNEQDEAKRAKLLDKCWADAGTYTDPMSDVAGREQLAAVVAGFHQQFPGAALAFTSGVDEHHGRIRFGWKMTGGPQPLEGIDVGRLAGDGRLESIIGFWGANPAAG